MIKVKIITLVGTAISMTYCTGKPILFVGVG
jgi:signal recognition particle GTPase